MCNIPYIIAILTVTIAGGRAEVGSVLHVATASVVDGIGEDTDLVVFVERLAAAGTDRATARAKDRICHAIAAGATPPGVRRLAECLAASVLEGPAVRRPRADGTTVVEAARSASLVVLEDVDAAAVARSVAALVADGRRVVVTAEEPGELARVRAVLPSAVTDRVVEDLPDLPAAEIRELRRLLATSTASRRGRVGQQWPDPALLPAAEEVAELCARAARQVEATSAGGLIPSVMAGLDQPRRDAVTSVAQYVARSLAAMPRDPRSWAWPLLSDLTYQRHRAAFDQLREETVQATAALDRARTQPPVAVTGPLPADALEVLTRYAAHLTGEGGRPGLRRRHASHRDAQPVLRLLRTGGRIPKELGDVSRAVEHLELGERLARIDRGCCTIGVAPPRDEAELGLLTRELATVAAAARAVGALRHDVLFLAEGSPLAVPDVDTAGMVAAAILDYAHHGVGREASRRLDGLVEALTAAVPTPARSAEHDAAMRALQVRDPVAYAAAVDALGAARREGRDEARQTELLSRLTAVAPGLAAAWARLDRTEASALGLVCLRPASALLDAVPLADCADVLVVLGAQFLGVERLLLAAVAPRIVAAVAPGAVPQSSPTLLGVLRRASASVVRGRTAPAVVPTTRLVPMPAPRPAPLPAPTPVGRAGG